MKLGTLKVMAYKVPPGKRKIIIFYTLFSSNSEAMQHNIVPKHSMSECLNGTT